MNERDLSAGRRLSMWLVLVALLVAFAEGGSFLALQMVKNSAARFLVWDPDISRLPKIWAGAAGRWDEDLGWPAPGDATAPPRNSTGAKLNVDFPDGGKACVAACGCFRERPFGAQSSIGPTYATSRCSTSTSLWPSFTTASSPFVLSTGV